MKKFCIVFLFFVLASCSAEQPAADKIYYRHGDLTISSDYTAVQCLELFRGNLEDISMQHVIGYWMKDLDHAGQERFIDILLYQIQQQKYANTAQYHKTSYSAVRILQISECPLSSDQYLRFARLKNNKWQQQSDNEGFKDMLDALLSDNHHILRGKNRE